MDAKGVSSVQLRSVFRLVCPSRNSFSTGNVYSSGIR